MTESNPAIVVEEFLRPREVRELLKVGRTTLYQWVRAGTFPAPTKYGPNTTGWPRSVVLAWQASLQPEAVLLSVVPRRSVGSLGKRRRRGRA